jgi:RimJ/RimL family protein N-acetyltransferase
MDLTNKLFTNHLIRLSPINHEVDAPPVSRWTLNPFIRSMFGNFPRPLSIETTRKLLEKVEKEMDDSKNLFHFMLRLKEDDRLVGMARIFWVDFHNGTGILTMAVGDEADRQHGYGYSALTLLLNFAFTELNLHRLSVWLTEDNMPYIQMVKKAGFIEEAHQTEVIFHDGRYRDLLLMGLLRSEWDANS